MQKTKTSPPPLNDAASSWTWLTAALLAQIGWGAYPVLLRYLQTVSGLPSLSLLAVGNLVVLLAVFLFIWPRLDKKLLRLPILWLFGLMVVVRGVSNLLATRFTLAIYVQLIYLLTPFLVAILSRVVLHEKLPRYTFRALTISLVGVLLVISGSFSEIGTATAVPRQDFLGISLAVGSSLALALYMLLTRRTAHYHATGESLLLVHLFALFSFSAVASLLLGENWNQWAALSPHDWLIFALLAFGILLGANLGQIRTIQHLGAPLVSSMMAIRLVSALAVGAFLLQEQLSSAWQVLGAAIVIVTITWFLRRQM